MPITHAGQVERMAKMCGSSIPEGLRRELHARGDDPEAVLDFGVAYATLQCAELLAAGAPGIHFYTLNRSPATRAILSALKLDQAVGAGDLPDLDLEPLGHAAASRRRPRSGRRQSRPGGRCRRPRRRAASASR